MRIPETIPEIIKLSYKYHDSSATKIRVAMPRHQKVCIRYEHIFFKYSQDSVQPGLRSAFCTPASRSFMGNPGEVRTRWGY